MFSYKRYAIAVHENDVNALWPYIRYVTKSSLIFFPNIGNYIRLHANRRNNSQHCWDLQCIVGRIQPISLCKPCIMSVRGSNNVGRAVQTNPTLLRYAWRSRNKRNVGSCWLKSLTGFKLCATTHNRVCKLTQHVTSNNVRSCWSTILHPFTCSLIMHASHR